MLLVVVALVASAAGGIGRLSDAATGRARAEATADLVALAAVHGGATAADRVARGNEGMLVDLIDHGDSGLTVLVERDGVRASSSAAEGGEVLGDEPGSDDDRQ